MCIRDRGTRGETDEYFEQAYEFIKSLDVTQLHVFSYSERTGTQALKIDHVVTPEEKHRRSQRLLELSDEKMCIRDSGCTVKLKDVHTGNTLNGKGAENRFNFIKMCIRDSVYCEGSG